MTKQMTTYSMMFWVFMLKNQKMTKKVHWYCNF